MTRAKSDHFDGRRFFNPNGLVPQPFTAVPRMMREPRTPWPTRVEVAPGFPPPLDGARAAVTFIGHSTFLIQTALGNILTDPMYSQRAGPFNRFGPERVRQPAIRFDDLPPIAIVLLSHNHYDHCDLHTLAMLATKFDPLLVTPLGNRAAGLVHRHPARRGARLVAAVEPRAGVDHADASPPFLGAHALRSQSRAVGRIRGGGGWRADLLRRGHRLRRRSSATSAGGSVRWTWP